MKRITTKLALALLATIASAATSFAGVDLTVTSIQDGGWFPTVTRVTVRNNGTSTAPASRLRVTLSSYTGTTLAIRSINVPSIAPGASCMVIADMGQPIFVDCKQLSAKADSMHQIAETNESNNTRYWFDSNCIH